MWVGGRRHFGRREQPGKEDQGGQWIHGCITSSLKKIPTELIHPNVSDLPGLLLQVLLAVHSTVDQQHARTEIRQVGYLWKGLEKVCKLPDNDVFKDTKSFDCWIKHTSRATIVYFVYTGLKKFWSILANLAVNFSLLSSMFPNLLHRQRPSSLKLSSGHQKSEA